MRRVILSVLFASSVVSFGAAVQAADSHPTAQPFDGAYDLGEPSYAVERERAAIPIDHLVLGAEHILDQQCHNGGFGWPHADCSTTYHNVTGTRSSWVSSALGPSPRTGTSSWARSTAAPSIWPIPIPTGRRDSSTFTPFFMGTLAVAADNTTFSTHVSVNLFDALAAGTYGPDDFDTAGWIASIEVGRSGAWVTSGRGSSAP